MKSDEFKLEQFVPYLLNQAAEASSLAFEKIYKGRYGMLRTEWRVLFHLGLYGRMTASEISARARMHKTKISRAVHRLTERRMVTRARDADDRRLEHLTLTTKGRAAYDDLRNVAQTYEAGLLKELTAAEIKTLRIALGKLAQAQSNPFT